MSTASLCHRLLDGKSATLSRCWIKRTYNRATILSTRLSLVAVGVLLLSAASAHAQWPNYPTPGIPRLPDGKPNLAAPAPQTADGKPDLTGIWTKDTPGFLDYFYDLAKDLPRDEVVMTPWAAALAAQREGRNHIDDPWGYCQAPPGVPRINVSSGFKLLQTPTVVAMLYHLDTGPVFRQVLM